MLPLFKSDFSIGKSILTLDLPEKSKVGGADSIFSIAISNKLKEVVLVEDSLTGFLQAYKNSEALDLNLIFGLRIVICSNLKSDPKDTEKKDESRIIIFAKNGSGCKLLNTIYSLAFTEGHGRIDYINLKKLWQKDNLLLAIPFYDSFIFKNAMFFSNCIPDFSFADPVFFTEDNGMPFDNIIKTKVEEYCSNKYEIENAKSIYYNERKDFAAFQTYKCICNRNYSSKEIGLTNPNLEHCGSMEFSFESWKENNEIS